ncbi:MAG: N-acetylmuramoyl-L-alanine amidase [Eubacteriales bacterium]|nr:N-acetylmuramoyl-L-alanine amidase [Eubacteriales bacterium]
MNINKDYISNNNSYEGQTPKYIVIHNTDNYSAGANAKAHAKAQHDGNFNGMSAHVYVDDTSAYQATPYNRGAWHVGVNYGGRLFGTVNNRNSVGIEMCVQAGYNYSKAFNNTVQVCKQLMKELGIPADRVVQHYDVCAKNCPSAIRAKGDWTRFKQEIAGNTGEVVVDQYYRIRKTWEDSKSQLGAYKSLENAKKDWKEGYVIYDWNGKAVYPVVSVKTKASLTPDITLQFPEISKGCTGIAVKMLQVMLGVEADGSFGDATDKAFRTFQKNTNQTQDGICGRNGWAAVAAHMAANTFE